MQTTLLCNLSVPAVAKIPRIGFLTVGRCAIQLPTRSDKGFVTLVGWRDKTIVIEYRSADGNEDRLPALAAELLRTNVDIIVASNRRATVAVRQLTENIPIVEIFVRSRISEPASPDAECNGVVLHAPRLGGKRLELLKEIIPGISRVAVLANVSRLIQLKKLRLKKSAQLLGL